MHSHPRPRAFLRQPAPHVGRDFWIGALWSAAFSAALYALVVGAWRLVVG